MAQAPKELLYLLRNLDDWHEPHSERHLVSIPGNVSLLDLRLQLPHDINAFAFSKYVKMYLKGRSLFATKELIRTPFLPKQTSMDQKESLDAFKLILMYTKDTSLTEKRRRLVADMLIQKGLSSEPLRDEILIQLCNQTLYSGNGFCDPSSVWILMAGCLGSFQPSQSLAKYLLKYVSDTKSSLGYGVVCQQKLLQSQNIDAKSPRSYPPCILEWTGVRMKSCIALPASFVDGVTIKGQVESWTTAEQFASNLLQSRRASTGILGWCVVLRHDRESFECAGHDYVLDLISEIEVVPGFPWGTAYFIATSDLSRPTNGVSSRYKWPDQPHDADRLRLMALETEELPDSGLFVAVRSPPPLPVSPGSSLAPSTPSSLSDIPPYDTVIHPEDIYASRDQALSQVSVLNKRSDKVPAILSKSSALNSRYHLANDLAIKKPPVPQGVPAAAGKAPPVNGVGPGRPAPGGRQNGGGLAPRNGEDMDAWLESVFRGVVNDGVGDLRNANAIERRLKGGGDELPSQLSMPFGGLGLGLDLSSYGIQQPMTTPIFSQPIVSQPIISPSLLSQPFAPQPLLPSSLQPSFLPQTITAVPGFASLLPDQSYLFQQQQQQQQQQRQQLMSQQTAELQVRLQQQELEKKVIQSSLETEILRHQLLQVQEQTRPVAEAPRSSSSYVPVTRDASPKYQTRPNSTKYPARKAVPARTYQEIEEEEEEEVDELDFQEPEPRPVRTRFVPASDSEPISVPKPKKKVSVTTRRHAEETPSLHPIIRNTTNLPPEEKTKGVSFSTEVVTISSLPTSPDVDIPSAPFSAAATAPPAPPPPPAKTTKDSSVKDGRTGKVEKTVVSVVGATAAAAASASKADDARPVSGAIGSQRRPPVKMGQIVWPPKPKEEETRPKYEPGRLMIDETKDNPDKVQAKQTPDEIQRKVNDKIQMAKKTAAAEGEDDEARKAKQAAPKKRPRLPSTDPLSPDPTSPRDNVFEPDNYHTLDMKTRQAALERKLVSVAWGTQKKSEVPKAVAAAAAASVPLPPLPPPVSLPPPPPPAPPVNDQVEIVAEVQEQRMTPFDLNSMDNIRTVLYAQCTEPFYTYHNVNWTLEIRKEFFRPMEKLGDPDLLYLVFCQIVFDVSSNDCIRLGKDDRRKMTALLDKFNIHPNNVAANHSQSTMMAVVDAAKTLPIYFSRIYAVSGGKRQRKVQMLAIGHSGVRLLTRLKDVCDDFIEVIENISFSEIQSVVVPKEGALVIRFNGKHFAIYSPRANQICRMIEQFRIENNKILQAANRVTVLDSSMSSDNFSRLNKN